MSPSGEEGTFLSISWKRWAWAALAALFTFSLLWGGLWVYRVWAIARPLEAELAQIPGVENPQVRWQGQNVVITLSLAPGVSLGPLLDAVEEEVQAWVKAPFRVVFRDNPTPRLEAFYLELNPILQEGLATGAFTDMAARVEARGKETGGMVANVYITQDAVWVLLREGDRQLIRSIPRGKGGAGR